MSLFTDIVEETFETMLRACGFVRVAKEQDLVRYESAVCTIALGHDSQRSSEVFLGLTRRNFASGPDFYFDEIIRAAAVPEDSHPSGYAVHGEKSIRRLLHSMAVLLEAYCMPLLRGDDAAWLRLVAQRESDATRYTDENNLRMALHGATEAWHAKEFGRVVELLSPHRHALGRTDRAKLDYAESELRSGSLPPG